MDEEQKDGLIDCLWMVRDRLKALGCCHGHARDDATPPMCYDDWICCVVAQAKAQAFAAGAAAMRERCAVVVERWHYKKGGYTELGHTLRELPLPTPEDR